MSPPPLGMSQSLKNSQIFLKDQNLASLLCSLPLCISLFKLWRLFNALFIPLFLFCYSRLKKGSLNSTSRLARVSEVSLSAKLTLSLEGDKWLADDALSTCLCDRFPSRFLLSAKRVDVSLSGWHSLSALSSLSETSTLALLQNNSFLPEIEEKLRLIPYTRLLLSTNKNKAKFIYNPTKRTINWGKYIYFVKIFYTKVSHIRRLPNILIMLFGLYSDFEVFSLELMHSLGLLSPTEICLWWMQWKLYSRMLRTCCVDFTLTRMWRRSAKPYLLKRMHGIMWWRLGGV